MLSTCYFILNSKLCSRRAITVRIRSFFANLILSFLNSKLHFQHATFIWCKASFPIWSYNLNLKFCFRLAIIIKIWNFDYDLMLELRCEVSFPAFYQNSNSKHCFRIFIMIQFRSLVFVLLLQYKFEALLLISRSNSNWKFCFRPQIRIQFKWEDETEMKHRSQFLLQNQLEPLSSTFWTRKFFSYFLFEWEVGNNISNSNLNQKVKFEVEF